MKKSSSTELDERYLEADNRLSRQPQILKLPITMMLGSGRTHNVLSIIFTKSRKHKPKREYWLLINRSRHRQKTEKKRVQVFCKLHADTSIKQKITLLILSGGEFRNDIFGNGKYIRRLGLGVTLR